MTGRRGSLCERYKRSQSRHVANMSERQNKPEIFRGKNQDNFKNPGKNERLMSFDLLTSSTVMATHQGCCK